MSSLNELTCTAERMVWSRIHSWESKAQNSTRVTHVGCKHMTGESPQHGKIWGCLGKWLCIQTRSYNERHS
jgi:hypothetical protein